MSVDIPEGTGSCLVVTERMLRSGKTAIQRFVLLAAVAFFGAVASAADLAARPDDLSGPVADPLAAVTAGLGSPVSIAAVIEPGAGGRPDVLAVTASLEEGWHLYSVTQKPGGPRPTRIALDPASPRTVAGVFEPDAPPQVRSADAVPAWKGLVIEEHAAAVTWRAPLAPGAGKARGTVSLQLCRDDACLPPETIAFTAAGGGAGGGGGFHPHPR